MGRKKNMRWEYGTVYKKNNWIYIYNTFVELNHGEKGSTSILLLTIFVDICKKNLGQVKITKFPVPSYYHIYGWGVILG